MSERIKQLKYRCQKGFTLIELMAVLAILAILLAIAIPAIGKVIDKSDASADESSIELIERAGEKAHVDKTPFDEPSGDMPEESYTIPTLIDKGYLDLDDDNKFNSPDHYVVKENNQNDNNPNNDEDTTTPNKSGNFVYVGIGTPGDGGTGGETGPTAGPSQGFTPVAVAPDGCIEIRTATDFNAINNDMAGCYTQMDDIDLSSLSNFEGIKGLSTLDVPCYNLWITFATVEKATTQCTGYHDTTFTGSYDGQRYKITGVTITTPVAQKNNYGTGLFMYSENGVFKNIALEGVNNTGYSYVGGIVGKAQEITISDSYVTGTVNGLDDPVGTALLVGGTRDSTITNSYSKGSVIGEMAAAGLAGELYNTKVINSYSTANVTGDWISGGLIGFISKGEVTNSHATGDFTANPYNGEGALDVGGLIGQMLDVSVTDSYATGTVTGGQGSGGLVGNAIGSSVDTGIYNSYATGNVIALGAEYNNGASGGLVGYLDGMKLENSYATGDVTVTSDGGIVQIRDDKTSGGLVGSSEASDIKNSYSLGAVSGVNPNHGFLGYNVTTTVTDSYYNSEPGVADTSGATPKTLAELKKQATFTGFDFTDVWKIDGANYPTLQ